MFKFKKLILIPLVIVLILATVACGKKTVEVDLDALGKEIASSDIFFDANLAEMSSKAIGTELGIDVATLESYHYFIGSSSTGEEYGLFKCNDADAAKIVVEKLNKRVEKQRESLVDYVPEAIPRLDNAIIESSGVYVAILVADNSSAAQTIMDGYFK